MADVTAVNANIGALQAGWQYPSGIDIRCTTRSEIYRTPHS